MLDKKQELIDKLEEKEAQLKRAERESQAWNRGRHKSASNAPVSKLYVESLRKEIAELRQQLKKL